MKISEARQVYSTQIREYQEERNQLLKQQKELENKMKYTEDGKKVYANEAAVLELTLEALEKKQDEYREYMGQLTGQWSATANMISSKQQGEAMKEYTEDLGKVLEVARRLMKGAIVPPQDEKKLMDYSMEMYQAAKNIGSMRKRNEKDEYESLWDEDKKDKQYEDPMEVADSTEAFAEGPAVVSVSETVASVTGAQQSVE